MEEQIHENPEDSRFWNYCQLWLSTMMTIFCILILTKMVCVRQSFALNLSVNKLSISILLSVLAMNTMTSYTGWMMNCRLTNESVCEYTTFQLYLVAIAQHLQYFFLTVGLAIITFSYLRVALLPQYQSALNWAQFMLVFLTAQVHLYDIVTDVFAIHGNTSLFSLFKDHHIWLAQLPNLLCMGLFSYALAKIYRSMENPKRGTFVLHLLLIFAIVLFNYMIHTKVGKVKMDQDKFTRLSTADRIVKICSTGVMVGMSLLFAKRSEMLMEFCETGTQKIDYCLQSSDPFTIHAFVKTYGQNTGISNFII